MFNLSWTPLILPWFSNAVGLHAWGQAFQCSHISYTAISTVLWFFHQHYERPENLGVCSLEDDNVVRVTKYSQWLRNWSGKSLAVEISPKCCKEHAMLCWEMQVWFHFPVVFFMSCYGNHGHFSNAGENMNARLPWAIYMLLLQSVYHI